MRRRWLIGAAVLILLAGVCLSGLYTAAPSTQESPVNTADLGMMLLDQTEGVSVLAVQEGSLAERVGIRPTDLLLQVNDTPFTTADEMEALLQSAAGSSIRLYLLRSGDGMEIRIPIGP